MNNKPMWHYDKRVQNGEDAHNKKVRKELIPPSKLQNKAQKT
jgi:hypothetical protein